MEVAIEEDHTFILENGSSEIKYSFSSEIQPHLLGNYIAKSSKDKTKLIGDVSGAKDKFGIKFSRPFDKGYCVNWNLEKEIWDYIFEKQKVNPKETSLLWTEPLFTPDTLKKMEYEVIFEEYEFKSTLTTSAPFLAQYGYRFENPASNFSKSPCALVVDSGFSFSHIAPFFDDHLINFAVKRVNIGGKALTNYLKEIVSYRHWNMMEETYLMNLIKERLCFISLDFLQDLEITQRDIRSNMIRCEYVLPDYVKNHTGYIKTGITTASSLSSGSTPSKKDNSEQVLVMNNERIIVPELLFTPSDIGINQAGIGEAVFQSVESCVQEMHALLYSNILVIGGNTLFPNYVKRLFKEVRRLSPSCYNVQIYTPKDPITLAWFGGTKFAQRPDYESFVINKKEYEEYGLYLCKHKFLNS